MKTPRKNKKTTSPNAKIWDACGITKHGYKKADDMARDLWPFVTESENVWLFQRVLKEVFFQKFQLSKRSKDVQKKLRLKL